MKRLYKETTMAITDVTTPFDTDFNIIQLEVVGNLMFYECIKKPYDSLTPIETLHVDRKPGKLTKEELAQYLYDNYYDAVDNTINLSSLNFSKMKCNVNIGDMEVEGNLWQDRQTVEGKLYQDGQLVKSNLWQGYQTVEGNLWQEEQTVEGDLHQDEQTVEGYLYQDEQTVKGNLYQCEQTVKGNLYQDKQTVHGKTFQDNEEENEQ